MAGPVPAIRIFAAPERIGRRLRSSGMSPASDKLQEKRARRHLSDRLREYYNSMKTMLEDDAERFFEQVMQQAHEQRQLQHRVD